MPFTSSRRRISTCGAYLSQKLHGTAGRFEKRCNLKSTLHNPYFPEKTCNPSCHAPPSCFLLSRDWHYLKPLVLFYCYTYPVSSSSSFHQKLSRHKMHSVSLKKFRKTTFPSSTLIFLLILHKTFTVNVLLQKSDATISITYILLKNKIITTQFQK